MAKSTVARIPRIGDLSEGPALTELPGSPIVFGQFEVFLGQPAVSKCGRHLNLLFAFNAIVIVQPGAWGDGGLRGVFFVGNGLAAKILGEVYFGIFG